MENVFAGPWSPVSTSISSSIRPAMRSPDGGQGLGTDSGRRLQRLERRTARTTPAKTASPNFRVFIDANDNGVWDSATEAFGADGQQWLVLLLECHAGVIDPPGHRDSERRHADGGLDDHNSRSLGYREIALGAGGSVIMQDFGLDNNGRQRLGDLPDSLPDDGCRRMVRGTS